MGAHRAGVARDRRGGGSRAVERARGDREIVRRRQERRVRVAACDRRARADARWRPGDLLQLSRGPGAPINSGDRARGIFRLRASENAQGRLRMHDRVRSIFRIATRIRARGRTHDARRSARRFEAPQSARGGDGEVRARDVLPERRRREGISARGARADSVVEGGDL